MGQEYKYKCRECVPSVRRECIEQARISPGVKRIIERAFDSHTDTKATWDLLQRNCLLVKRDEAVLDLGTAKKQSGLLGRLQKRTEVPAVEVPAVEEPKESIPVVRPPTPVQPGWEPNWDAELRAAEAERAAAEQKSATFVSPRKETDWEEELREAEEELAAADDFSGLFAPARPDGESGLGIQEPLPSTPPIRDIPQMPPLFESLRRINQERLTSKTPAQEVESTPPPQEQPAPAPTTPTPITAVRYPPVSPPQPMPIQARGPRMLVAQTTGHRILLPEEGELVLGRSDPYTRTTPDVDLTAEDKQERGVSRRHALISAWRGQYQITDLGSSNGTWLNSKRIALHQRQDLQVGDEVRLGRCRLFLAETPALWREPQPHTQYFLYVTFTGRYFSLPDQDTVLIGRSDPSLGYKPDIDLSNEGEIASVVSRNHAKITRSGNQFTVEDLGSAYKTRVNGQPAHIGVRVPIKPGQHLWLGGCILAFDVVAKEQER